MSFWNSWKRTRSVSAGSAFPSVAILEVGESEWQPIIVTDEEGNEYSTKQEVAEVFFVPDTKNTKKDTTVFRYLVTREAVEVQHEFKDDSQISIFTSEYAEQKLHLEKMEK